MTHLEEQDLMLHYYGESSDEVSKHLATCESCRQVAENFAGFLRWIPDDEVPERPDRWEDEIWGRLEWRLKQEKRRSWLPIVAAAAVIAIAFVAGLMTRDFVIAPGEPDHAEEVAELTSDAEGRNRVFLLVVSDHLDRSERALLELTHDGSLVSEQRQARAEELVTMNRLYRLTAEQSDSPGLASLLEEIEPILVEIARSSTSDENSLEPIRKRVEDRELIFKIRVLGQQVRKDAVPEPAHDASI